MVQTKGSSKKQQKQKQKQKRGVDFKKIKRKLGRKLPPPQNATNTEIKSKAIILPEQSVASEKTGLPVSKKGLTLKELLQHTSHHNPKVRKDALIGIQDIFQRYPAELKLHKLAVIEKLRERMRDDDKFVRESLYQLLKSVVFPNCKEEDNQGPFISLMMAYIFNAMTHLAIDVRLMAFKFLDLVIQYYPSCFSLYADKILQNFDVILRKNQFYLQDKGKLKTALAGLTGCLLLLPCNKKKDNSSRSKVTAKRVLHAYEPDVPKDPAGPLIMKKLNDLFPVLVNCFQDFKTLIHSMPVLDAQSFDCMLSILQSIVLTIRFFAYEMERSQEQLWPHNEEINIAMLHQTMSPALMKKLWDSFPLGSMHQLTAKDNERYFTLNIIITEIFLRTSDWISPPVASVEIFLQFIESALSEKISSGVQSGKAFHEKQLLPIVPFIPKLTKLVSSSWKHQILQSFNRVFKNCNPESSLKLACLSAIAEFLCPEDPFMLGVELSDPEIRDYQISWIRDLPSHLILLGDKHPSCSEAVVRLQLRMGQRKSFQEEYDNLQYSLLEFYSTRLDDGSVHHGPFVKLPSDIQELCLCCLCYVSVVDPLLLQSLALCCLCDDLEPKMQLRIVEVLEEAYTQGHIQIADYISFLLTLLARYKVYPDKVGPVIKNDSMSNRHAFRSITHRICSLLLRIGDAHLLFQIMENITIDQISREPPVDNMCALLRMLAHLDSSPTRLSERSIIKLSCVLPGYLIDVVSCIGEDDQDSKANYYLVAVFYLFTRSNKLRTLVIKKMAELVPKDRSTCRISAIVSAILLLAKDDKVSRCLLCCKTELECILCSILELKSCEEMNLNIEENHKIQCTFDQLNSTMTTLFRGALIA